MISHAAMNMVRARWVGLSNRDDNLFLHYYNHLVCIGYDDGPRNKRITRDRYRVLERIRYCDPDFLVKLEKYLGPPS